MDKSFTFSLSRWHNIAERLSRMYVETAHRVRETLTNTSLTAYLGASQERRLAAEAERAAEQLQSAFALQDAPATIRQALSTANEKHGVSHALARFEVLNRRLKYLASLIDGQSADMVAIAELKDYRDLAARAEGYRDSRPPVRVRMIDEPALARLRSRAEEVQAEVFALGDRIAELNRATMALALPENVARLAGL